MKTVLFLFIIASLEIFISFSFCQQDVLHQEATKSQPRKIKKIQILNPRKFLKVRSNESQKWNLKKRIDRKEAYTVFPAIVERQENRGVPDSPFFQQEYAIDQKTRVKKVLPDYLFKLNRKKRSFNNDDRIAKNITAKAVKKKKKRSRDDGAKTNEAKRLNIKLKKEKDSLKFNRTKHIKGKLRNKTTAGSLNPRLKHTKKSRKRNLRKRNQAKKVKRKEKIEEKIKEKHENKNRVLRKKQKKEERDGRRLIAGKEAMIADYPYVVSIQKSNEHWCAGALLNPRLVITTANCVWKSNQLSRLRVRAGSRHADRGGQVARIQEVMKHPNWSIRRNPNNDVALLLLDRNIKFSDKVHGLDLPNHAMMPAFEDAWVTSWGAERRDGIFQNTQFTLQVYHSRLMDHDKCNNVTQRFGVVVSENFICLTQTGRRAPCTRDTGAPAVSDGILWGLASWGIRKLCGTERFPAMFSYTASPSNLDFITNATHVLMSEQRHYPFPDRFPIVRTETKPTTVTEGINYMY